MAQFIVYENANRATKKTYPYLLDIQSSLLDELRTTVVIPLCPSALAGNAAISKLCPVVESVNFILLTQQIAGVDRKNLGKEICNLSHARIEILAALDFIVSGI
ncbi:MAG: CcdB family protein [Methylococcaceae bacterium]|nr:CcdB family protein [Methylococcaceae bacterium]MDZ4155491.1 CcdB family protein [Methylococcales bacterium]MDP2395214.1 CcdB family protein [Methylococcaceae bacterium]MDP3020674.1 CcdB family protein [Methylococcaceae bacterium]MDP3390112.1 CcdB family protein [Methylococcaceae bacterium]